MTREEAVHALALATLRTWTAEKRREQLDTMKTEVWVDHPRWPSLEDDIRAELERGAETRRPEDPRYDPVLLLALASTLRGVRNEYLEQRLGTAVVGEVEPMLLCPCCGYRTLDERGEYSICPVCIWEDDGSDDPQAMSGPNHMTLAQGRANFAAIGAVMSRKLALVDPEGRAKYARG